MSKNKSHNKFLMFFQDGKFPKYTRVSLDIMWNITLFFLVIGIVSAFFVGGLGVGYFASLVKDIPVSEADEMEQMVYNYEETSEVYFANNEYLGEIRGDIHREEISAEQVSDMFIDAIIATEDEYFEEHNGIVPKAIMRALYQEFSGSPTQTGGSTLTQQLVKNQILSSEVSFERKAEEIFIALRMENFFDKNEILEAYLNVVPFGRDSTGRNIAGIQAAAQGIFDVDASDLNLPQAAYIAGLPQSPYGYTPYASGGSIKPDEELEPGLNRMETVLYRMLSAGKVTEDEYEEALAYDITEDFTDKRESIRDEYPWVADEVEMSARDIIAKQLAEEAGDLEEYQEVDATQQHYRDLARHELRHSGLEIHTTINKDIYDNFQDVKDSFEHYGRTVTVQIENPETEEVETEEIPVEAGALLMENQTGAILAFVGGRDFDRRQVNNATYNTRPPGSTMKPLFGYAVGMELGIIQPGSPLLDIPFEYNDGYTSPWTPSNFISQQQRGLVDARSALADSDNVPIARLMINIIQQDDNPARFLEGMGISDGENVPSNVLGGSPYLTVEQNVAAYATFTNEGDYVEPYMIEKIVDREGEVVYEHETDREEVFSAQTSYLMLDMMRDVINSGTATYVNSILNHSGVDWAGKTGTSDQFEDAWFVASNPNVTMGTWMGYYAHDHVVDRSVLRLDQSNYSRNNLRFWSELVNAATEAEQEFIATDERFSSPGGIVSRSYCALSGSLPSEMCEELGLVQTDLFNIDHVPSEEDNSMTSGRTVQIDGEAFEAVDETPDEFTEEGFFLREDFINEHGWGTSYQLGSGWSNPVDISNLLGSGDWSDLIVGDSEDIEDDGNPNSPNNVSISSGTLEWDSAGGQVVGYRILSSSSEDGDFEEIGHTTTTSYDLPSEDRAYAVVAVSLYGHESSSSDSVVYGTIEDEEDEEDEESREDEEDEEDEEASSEQDGNDNNDDNNNDNNDDRNDDENDDNDSDEDEDEENNDDS
ncbi:transglycosylase domain-containing protein [Alkalibacillus silvisoli]|uniref:Penicillin-sensitive transpeptidase n=1 Tax=Alkalibacillus silvisoli TaxID=392823 RepID=A0ABP3JK23_9BACI